MTPDRWDRVDGRTYAVALCERHPPAVEQSDRALIFGVCDRCGGYVLDGKPAARMLAARRILRERGL